MFILEVSEHISESKLAELMQYLYDRGLDCQTVVYTKLTDCANFKPCFKNLHLVLMSGLDELDSYTDDFIYDLIECNVRCAYGTSVGLTQLRSDVKAIGAEIVTPLTLYTNLKEYNSSVACCIREFMSEDFDVGVRMVEPQDTFMQLYVDKDLCLYLRESRGTLSQLSELSLLKSSLLKIFGTYFDEPTLVQGAVFNASLDSLWDYFLYTNFETQQLVIDKKVWLFNVLKDLNHTTCAEIHPTYLNMLFEHGYLPVTQVKLLLERNGVSLDEFSSRCNNKSVL